MSSTLDSSSLGEGILKIVTQLGQLLKVDWCILRPFRSNSLLRQTIIYPSLNLTQDNNTEISLKTQLLEQTIWETQKIEIISCVSIALAQENSPQQQQKVEAYQKMGIGASLLVPLILDEKLIAVLGLHHCRPCYSWSEDEILLTTILIEQITLAISQAQAYEEVRNLAHREALINTITAAIRASLDPEVIFKAITYQLGQGLGIDGCALSLWTKTDEFVQCVGLYDRHEVKVDPLPQSIVPIAQNRVLQKLLSTMMPVIFEDMDKYPDMNQFDLPLRQKTQALLIVPLIVDGEIIGSISLRQVDRPRHWLSSEIKLAQAVASQAAIAVQQARLYDKTKQQAEQLRQSEQRVKQLNRYLTESVLKRFLPASIVNKVATGELSLDLRPEPRLVTILFSDLVGFTPLATQLGAQAIATLLNEYFEAMTVAVFDYGGTVDKFIGDALMALFGAPEDLSAKEQAHRAIAAARGMYRQLEVLNQRWKSQGLVDVPVQFRCGINQGSAVVGMFGGVQRSDYTAIGPAVNMAARLQEVAEANAILVSETVAEFLNPQEIQLIQSLKLKGIEESIVMFSVRV
ncbi:GAF domain-containing protein [Aphanothece sacrum]|uniref:GAF domain-containing protein n=2 Tax=Aphanothece sacrum TaxID=1122 RepID=UPI001D131F21|nr:GAF domain-containing protein [Aphanothece sacrum]